MVMKKNTNIRQFTFRGGGWGGGSSQSEPTFPFPRQIVWFTSDIKLSLQINNKNIGLFFGL